VDLLSISGSWEVNRQTTQCPWISRSKLVSCRDCGRRYLFGSKTTEIHDNSEH